MRSVDDFLALLKGVKKAHDGHYTALCPGHHDTKPSLSIKEADDKILLQCFAGCELPDILKPLGLESRDLFLNNYGSRSKAQKKLVATFTYEIERGMEAYSIERWQSGKYKDFRVKHEENGKYVYGMGGQSAILYHLPEVKEWIASGKAIRIPEGEEKADRLISLGLPATSSPFGAGRTKWWPKYSAMLAGADVIILPDNDRPGREFAEIKAKSLYGTTKSVKVVELPGLGDKGDIIDWLDIGHTKDDLLELEANCPKYEPPPEVTLPEILVTDRHLRDITAEALDALYEANNPQPRIFRRSGMLVRISQDEHGRPFTEALGKSAFRGCLERSCNFAEIRSSKHEDELVPVPPPLTLVQDCLSLGDWQFPPLLGITEVPVIRPDGTVATERGYDGMTNLYYFPSPRLSMPVVPNTPTDSDVKAAIKLALEPVWDFPFDSEASGANAVATMFTPILRPMIDGPVPLAIIDKPQPGTGASLLTEVISIIATGRPAAMMTARKDDEEWRKAITSLLLRSQLVVTIDNIEGTLYAPSLAAVLTATTYQDRILGRSEIVTLPNCTTWIGTGNNIKLAGDLPRRCIWVRMDARMARPWLRDTMSFKHPKLMDWAFKNRGAILEAILTIARAWVVAGMPEASGLPNLGGYESYSRVVGGVLAFMGVRGFLGNLDAMYNETDTETPQWEVFLEAWHGIIGDKPLTAVELIGHLSGNAELRAALPDCIAEMEAKNYSVKLGQNMGKKQSVRYPNRFALIKAGEKKRAVTWKVVRFEDETSPNFSFKGEVGEVQNTPPHMHMEMSGKENRNMDEGGVEITSPNLTLASKKSEVGPGELSTTKEFIPADDRQEVQSSAAVSSGREIRMGFGSGKNCARKPPETDRREVALGMPIEGAVELWRTEGAPVIHLGPCENCLDLEKLLADSGIADRHLQAVKVWLSGQCPPKAGNHGQC